MNEPTTEQPRRRRAWATRLATMAIALIVAVLLWYAIRNRPAKLAEGSAAPTFRYTAFDGTSIDLASQRGKVVVVNFFASWCDPCREEAADLEQVWREYQSRGVQFYGIGFKNAEAEAKAFLETFGVTYPASVDPSNRTAHNYGVDRVPETFVIDQSGMLARHFVGIVSSEDLAEELDRLLQP